jgi:hypothetical protein
MQTTSGLSRRKKNDGSIDIHFAGAGDQLLLVSESSAENGFVLEHLDSIYASRYATR